MYTNHIRDNTFYKGKEKRDVCFGSIAQKNMAFFLLILFMLTLVNCQVAQEGTFQKDYLSREKTNSIKGIFVVLILFSHYSQYVTLGGAYDAPYISLKNHLNQMVVAMFLFYSGYGMMESISKKGFAYIKAIPVRRFLKVLLNFDLAVCLFLILGMLQKHYYDIPTILWSLIGWESVGNSNWYIFAVLVLYLLTFIAFLPIRWCRGRAGGYLGAAILTILSIAFVYVQMKMDRPGYCYNTIILFALGFWYSLFKEKIEWLVMKNDLSYVFAVLLMVVVYVVSFRVRFTAGIEGYTVWAVAFTLLVVLFTMKISLHNAFLSWFGNHVFSVYILQRIPMQILQGTGRFQDHRYEFLILTFVTTIFLAMVFDRVTGKLFHRLTGK